MVKRIRTSPVEEISQWQTIYCSLMLLLVVLFVMLIAYSSVDSDRMMRLKIIRSVEPVAPSQPYGMSQAMRSLQQMTDDLGMKKDLFIQKTEDGFKAVIPNPVLFASGDATLDEAVYPMLDGIVKIAKHNDLAIQVDGHTDNVPIETGKFPSNWELSTMRAVNILRYLQWNGGIPSTRLVAIGFAQYRPVADNATPEGRRKNRRIEIIFRRAV
ncbi:MAG: OmpA family protein [Pseudomonadota bacterium]